MTGVQTCALPISKRADELKKHALGLVHDNPYLNTATKARLKSASHRHAKRWLSQTPRSAELTLSNPEFGLAVRHLLGLPPANDMPELCACSHAATKNGKRGAVRIDQQPYDHFMCCPLFRKTSMNDRHNWINGVLVRSARAAEFSVSSEVHHSRQPLAPAGSSMRERAYRPDSVYGGTYGRFHVDVSVAHPLAQSCVVQASKTPLAAAADREQVKRKKAGGWPAYLAVQFYPFVVESYGAVGKQAEHVLDIIARQAEEQGAGTKRDVRNLILTRLSLALQRGNARVYQLGLQKAHARAAGLPVR